MTDTEKKKRWALIMLLILLLLTVTVLLTVNHSVDVEIEGEGTVEPSHATVMTFGAAEFKITPADGWKISEVLVDGKSAEIENNILKLKGIVRGIKIKVTFVPLESYKLNITSEGFGSVGHPESESYTEGEEVPLTMVPEEGYVVGDVFVDGVSVGSTNYLELIMDSERSVEVIFREINDSDPTVNVGVDVTVGVSTGAYYGTISPSGPVRVAYGGSLTVTISLNEGYSLKSVKVDGVEKGTSDKVTINNITKNIDVDVSVVSTAVTAYTVTVTSTNGGTVTPSGTVTVNEGDDLTFTVSPYIGYHLSSLTVDGVSVTVTGGKYVLNDIRKDIRVSAAFAADTPSKRMTSISVSGGPEYCYLGDELDTSKMTVKAAYSDGSSYAVTGYSLSEKSWTAAGTKTVTVTYGGFTDSFTMIIPALKSIEITKQPNVTVFGKDTKIDLTGMTVTAYYEESGYDRSVTYTFTPEEFASTGEQTVTVSYTEGEKTCAVPLSVTVVEESFSVKVTSYKGTKVVNGDTVTFDRAMNTDLRNFTFDLSNIIPGITQKITLKITNDTLSNLNAYVFVSSMTEESSTELAKQIILSCGGYEKSVYDAANGSLLSLGTLNSKETGEVTLTVSFPHSEHNNEVMGRSIQFSVGISADKST